jgi:hypothetical protein
MGASALVIFRIGSHFMSRQAWTLIPLFVLFCIAGMIDAHYCCQWLKIGVSELFAQAGVKLLSS